MNEKPILFSTAMVEAILQGRKTQTRRVVTRGQVGRLMNGDQKLWPYLADGTPVNSPYGKPGNTLWVRETWATVNTFDHLCPNDIPKGDAKWPHVWYCSPVVAAASMQNSSSPHIGKKRPSIFMPRWASRITLDVLGVRVEKLQDITNMDAVQEGVDAAGIYKTKNARSQFEKLWNTINATRGYSWQSNPWVWVVEFESVGT